MKKYVQPLKILLLSLSLIILLGLSEKDSSNNPYILEGQLINYTIEKGTGILLPEAIDIDGMKVREIYFDQDDITPRVPRKYMSYSFEVGNIIHMKFDRVIPLTIRIKKDSLEYSKIYDRASAVIDSVISLDGEEDPTSKITESYPIDYYKSVFYTYAYENHIKKTPDIYNHRFYRDTSIPIVGSLFKSAVDNIYHMGFIITLQDSEYEINRKKRNADE